MTDEVPKPKPKRGRPRKLEATDQTIGLLQGLGQIQATTVECAAVLNVDYVTFLAFLNRNRGEMRAVYERSKEQGKASLRRTQFRIAQSNVAMAIFLGKNYLNQSDKHELTGTIQHTISSELHKLLMANDGQQRSLPDYIEHVGGPESLTAIEGGAEEVREPGMEDGQPLSDRKPNGKNGHL
jgi:hypothetical protein